MNAQIQTHCRQSSNTFFESIDDDFYNEEDTSYLFTSKDNYLSYIREAY